VTLSFVDQTFSQTQLPEPATAILLRGGLMGSAVVMRYRLG
jgi:hypothetical protein